MLVVLTAFITFMATLFGLSSHFDLKTTTSNADNSNQEKYANMETYFEKVKSIIEKYYLWKDDIDEKKLETAAIEGFVSGLGDEYTEFIPADEMKEYTEDIVGNFIGIGIYMIKDEESNRVVVYYPIPGSPAEKAGIEAGDLIKKVDGKEYFAKDFDNISNYIKGEEGTNVNIVVERDGKDLTFDVKREKINTNPISIKLLENNIGYLSLPSFDSGTANDFKTKVEELQKQGAQKLIIDLRNNGGGIVNEATDIADFLLDKGKTIISTKDNKDTQDVTISKEDPIFTMPVVVLVNHNTASSSEILSCSLQDNERAKIVGTTTFGKGIIQTLFSLNDGSGIKITTEEYYTPKGNTINKIGIKPDEEVKIPDDISNIYAVEEDKDTQLQKAIEILK